MALGLEERASLGWLAILRAIAGGLFLFAGIEKLRAGFDAGALRTQLAAWQGAGRTFGFYREQLDAQVIPRLDAIATAITAGELAAGASLLLGLGSRLGALGGLFLNVNYFLASRESINLLMAAVNLAVLVAGGGRALGLDGAIRARMPRWFLG